MQSALCTDWVNRYLRELTGLADVAAEERVALPSESAEGKESCSVSLRRPGFDASGADRDFHRSLLVVSVFRRGVKVHAASAAASRSLLRALLLHMSNYLVSLTHTAGVSVCLVVASSLCNYAHSTVIVLSHHTSARLLSVSCVNFSSTLPNESAADTGMMMSSLRVLGKALAAIPHAKKETAERSVTSMQMPKAAAPDL